MSTDQPTGERSRAVTYACLALAGASMIVFPSPLYEPLAWLSVTLGGALLAIPGTIAAIAVLVPRYRIEWAALPPLLVGVLLYTVLAFAGVIFDARPTGLAGAFGLAGLAGFVMHRLRQIQSDDRRARLAAAARGDDDA